MRVLNFINILFSGLFSIVIVSLFISTLDIHLLFKFLTSTLLVVLVYMCMHFLIYSVSRFIFRGIVRLYLKIGEGYYKKQNYERAIHYFKFACKHGDLKSCGMMAYMYDLGEGVEKNYRKARELYADVCSSNDPIGCNNLGFMYENGLGVKKDKDLAVKYYHKACSTGYQVACDNLKRIKSKGSDTVLKINPKCL